MADQPGPSAGRPGAARDRAGRVHCAARPGKGWRVANGSGRLLVLAQHAARVVDVLEIDDALQVRQRADEALVEVPARMVVEGLEVHPPVRVEVVPANLV